MSIYLLHTSPEGKKTLYSFMSHVPKEIPRSELSEIAIPTDKAGLRDAFQEVLDMIPVSEPTQTPIVAQRPLPDAQLTTREQFDNAWESFPLALQLHYAALATENAREQIRSPKPSG